MARTPAIRRRDFLKASAAAAASITLLGIRPRSGRADGVVRAKRVLLVDFPGGLRSHAAWYALPRGTHNPWDVQGTFGVVPLGRILFHPTGLASVARGSSWPGAATIPDLTSAATGFSLIGAVQHAPGGFRAGDHADDGLRMATGYYDAARPGLLTVLNRYLGKNAAAPVAMVGPSTLGQAKADWSSYAPAELVNYQLPEALPPAGNASVGRPVEDRLDARFLERTRGANRLIAQGYLGSKSALRQYAPVLIQRSLHFGNPGYFDEAVGGVTNRMLLEAMGDPKIKAGGAPDFLTWNGALAVRLLQLGSPAISVRLDGEIDAHSGEATKAPENYPRFAQVLAGLHFALSRTPAPEDGRPLLDTTLVVVMSEFGRTAKGHPSGFVDGKDGSEHWVWDQPHLIFGAGTKAHLLAPIDKDGQRINGQFYSTQALLSTICWATGIDTGEIEKLWPSASPLHPEVAPIGDLWA